MDINKNIYLIIKKNTFSRKIPFIMFDYFLRPSFSDVEFQMISRLFACVCYFSGGKMRRNDKSCNYCDVFFSEFRATP